MSANRARDTKPELTLRKALYHIGHRGYRLHHTIQLQKPARSKGTSSPRVRPDITFVSKKVAIFVHGCYWHRCPKCNYPLPKTNTAFWQAKFTRNTARDTRNRHALQRLAWTVITVWECDLKNTQPHSSFVA